MRKFLTFASLLLLTGCGPRYCFMGVPNPFYDPAGPPIFYEDDSSEPDGKHDPGGQMGPGGADSGGGAAFAPSSSSTAPPLTVAGAPAAAPKQAHRDASKTHPAPMSLASRTVSSPTRPRQYTGEPKYSADGSSGYDPYLEEPDDRDYVRPRTAGRDRIREDYRPRRPDYVTRREDHREPKYREDRGMYGDGPRLHRDTGRRRDHDRVGRREMASSSGDHRRDGRGDRDRTGRDRKGRDHAAMSGDDGGRNRRHVNRYDGSEMAAAGDHRGRRGEADDRRSRRRDAGPRRERRHARDDVG